MATIFHISDLHISGDLLADGYHFLDGTCGHDPVTFGNFIQHINERIVTLERNNEDYLVLLTGDITRKGSKASYYLAERLLGLKNGGALGIEVSIAADPKKIIVIPGNHDSYDGSYIKPNNNLIRFNGYFNPSGEYPILEERKVGNTKFIIIGFDSTYGKFAISPQKKLGRGIIEQKQFAKADGYLKKAKSDFVIACLHHSPIFPPNGKRNWSLILEKSTRLISWINKNKIDCIMYGHIHDDFFDALPLHGLLRLMPKKRGITGFVRRTFRDTNILMDFQPISINGRKAKYYDSLAYYYLCEQREGLMRIKDFNTVKQFSEYLKSLEEYQLFIDDIKKISKNKTAFIMAGSACQAGSKNSYLELDYQKHSREIKVKRYVFRRNRKEVSAYDEIIPLQ